MHSSRAGSRRRIICAIVYRAGLGPPRRSSAWHAKAGWTLRAGLVEDAIPRHAQDVTFFLSLSM
jgi:hypothetical protein